MLSSYFLAADGVVAGWVSSSFPIIRIVLLIIMVLIAIALVVCVMIQPSSNNGMSALQGQTSDTYYSKNKQQSLQGIMRRLTIILGIALAVLSILFFVTLVIYPAF